MNIVLIGMSGSGKTTIGDALRKKLDLKLIDTDEEIKKYTSMEIEDIFKEKGEAYFRDLETKILEDNKNIKNAVIATGGGIILRDENIDMLKLMGRRILLRGTSDTLVRNLKNSQEVRPLLKDAKDLKLDIINMIETRKSNYLRAADYVINIDDKSVESIVDEIVQFINIDRWCISWYNKCGFY